MADEMTKSGIESLLKAKKNSNKRPKLMKEADDGEVNNKEPNEEAQQDDEANAARNGPVTKMTSVKSAVIHTNFEMESDLPNLDIVQGERMQGARRNSKKDRVYTGSVLVSTGKPHGSGQMMYDDGRIASGNWVSGVLHGQGCVVYPKMVEVGVLPNGEKKYEKKFEKYFGNFRKHQRHGKGVYIYTDGSKYVGDFNGKHRHGIGRYIAADKKTYIGEFEEGKFKGYGMVLDADNTVFESGRFEDWKLAEQF